MQKSRHIRIKFGEKVAIAAFAGAVAGMLAANAANQINAAPAASTFAEQSRIEQSAEPAVVAERAEIASSNEE